MASDAGIALKAQDVSKRYGATVALDRVSLSVARGECVALVGESGAGKTTLMCCFNRLVDPDEGRVEVEGVDVLTVQPSALRRRLGYVPQEGGLLPHWRVLRNAALVPWLNGALDPEALAAEALELVGLPAARFGTRWPSELSGGQRQRVALARALAARPRVVLLDEAFGALDAISRGELVRMYRELHRRLGLTTLLVTHDLSVARRLADRIGVLRGGRFEQLAPDAELIASPATSYVQRLLEYAGVRA